MKKQTNLQGQVAGLVIILLMINTILLPAQVSISKTDVTCFGAKDGSATVTVNGGTPPYTYKWSPVGGNGPTASNLPGGNYTVEVTDANNCMISKDVKILEPPEINVNIAGGGAQVEFCSNQAPPSVTLTITASGGIPPYTYSWPGGSITVNTTGSYTGTATDSKGCSKKDNAAVAFIPVLCSQDPNDISGPEGYDTLHWIPKDLIMPFTIRFENDPEFATAPAQKVTVNKKVHPSLNIFSFRLGNFGFGDFTFSVPPNSTFYTQRLDVRDSLGIFVDVIAGIDIINNELFWRFESIDPMTGFAPVDASIGFLPVNDSIRQLGEGFVDYTIMPKSSVTSGDTITAMATIVFDINESIETNVWLNTIDAIAPTSKVIDNFTPYSDTTTILITFQGSDDPNGTGIKSYNLYYSKNNGPFTLYQEFSADTIATFFATSGNYKFYSIAVDHVGNQEAPKYKAEAEITMISNLRYAIYGTLNYDNFNKTPLQNSMVLFKDNNGVLIDSAITGNDGEFQFGNIRTGNYILNAATSKIWGGVNATDALIINRASVQMVNLDPIQQVVADVNNTSSITAADALLTLRRSLGLDNYFDAGDWYFLPDTVKILGDSIYGLMVKGLCMGDVNKSFQPTNLRMFKSVTPVYSGIEEVGSNEFVYPVYVFNPTNLGAIYLKLNYPADQVQVTGITFKGKDMLYNDLGGSLLIGWQQLSGEKFSADEMLLGINMKKKNSIISETVISTILDEPSELADPNAEVIYGTQIRLPEVHFKSKLPEDFLFISSFPNPCDQYTTFSYQLPEEAKVEIRLFNTLGELVTVYNAGDQTAGDHLYRIDVSNLASGVYHYTLKAITEKQEHQASGKLVTGVRN